MIDLGVFKLSWYKYELLKYVAVLMAILSSVPAMHDLFYERSKLHIASIQYYKNPYLDAYMRFFSFIGDGDGYYFVIFFIWARGKW